MYRLAGSIIVLAVLLASPRHIWAEGKPGEVLNKPDYPAGKHPGMEAMQKHMLMQQQMLMKQLMMQQQQMHAFAKGGFNPKQFQAMPMGPGQFVGKKK